MIDSREMKELLAAQNDKITMLYNENKELKTQISKLKKEALEAQEEALRFKVDISGITEGTYETYDQLRSKVAEVMIPTCEGNTEEDRWNTSTSIPIIDCQRLGTYNRNIRRVVRVTFLYMKHKNCLLSRKRNLPRGIYVDHAYPDMIKKKRAILRPILKLTLNTEGYKGKCTLDHDQLIIKGTKYNIDTLDKLPNDLAPYKANQNLTIV